MGLGHRLHGLWRHATSGLPRRRDRPSLLRRLDVAARRRSLPRAVRRWPGRAARGWLGVSASAARCRAARDRHHRTHLRRGANPPVPQCPGPFDVGGRRLRRRAAARASHLGPVPAALPAPFGPQPPVLVLVRRRMSAAFVHAPALVRPILRPDHPLKTERAQACYELLAQRGVFARGQAMLVEPRPATRADVLQVHTPEYVAAVERLSLPGAQNDPDAARWGLSAFRDTPAFEGMYEYYLLV